MSKKTGDILWIVAIATISYILLSPSTNPYYVTAYTNHPYLMGALKFAILAPLGELLATRIKEDKWLIPLGFSIKVAVWAVLGVIITLFFNLFPIGIQGLIDHGFLFMTSGFAGIVLFGLYNSIALNYVFAPIFMGAHRISDVYIDSKMNNDPKTISECVELIDWADFIKFIVFKMIPAFWLPAQVVTFSLPGEYRIIMAAYLSIVLGVMLAIVKRRSDSTLVTQN